MKFISAALVVLLLGLPVAAPLTAETPCCPIEEAPIEPMARAADSCCSLSASPETATPARLTTAPVLAAPTPAGPAICTQLVPSDTPAGAVFFASRTVTLQIPLRL